MSREPIRIHRSFQTKAMRPLLLWDISRRFHRLSPRYGQVAHALRTLPPVAANVLLHRAAPRLACVKPAASVHPEPGSNSSLYIVLYIISPTLLPNTCLFHSKKFTLALFSLYATMFPCTCLLSYYPLLMRLASSSNPSFPRGYFFFSYPYSHFLSIIFGANLYFVFHHFNQLFRSASA